MVLSLIDLGIQKSQPKGDNLTLIHTKMTYFITINIALHKIKW